ncbi:hypothetical protein [Thiococcus pfennigii]|nr:hypothetical protein [Thiococcus pfennigii]
MPKTQLGPLTLSALLPASPLAMAVDGHHPAMAAAKDSESARAPRPIP